MRTSDEAENRCGKGGEGPRPDEEGWRKRPPGPETTAGDDELSGLRMRATLDNERFDDERASGKECAWWRRGGRRGYWEESRMGDGTGGVWLAGLAGTLTDRDGFRLAWAIEDKGRLDDNSLVFRCFETNDDC